MRLRQHTWRLAQAGLTLTQFAPMLTKAGVSEATLRKVLVDNPRRFLAVTPKI